MKRYIRLKERSAVTRIHTPSEDYLKIRPTLECENYFEHTNEDNFLSAEVVIESNNKIFVLGGSFVENIYCDVGSRICSVLGKKLALNGFDLSVTNSGVSGSTSLNLMNMIINKIIPLKPTHIIFFIPTNDGLCLELKGGLWNSTKHYSHLQGINHISEKELASQHEKIKNICNLYSMLKALCDSFNVNLTVCSSPIVDGGIEGFYLYNKASHEKFSKDRNLVFDTVLRYCKNKGIDTLDLRPEFSNKLNLFFDPVHTNAPGSEEVAHYLYKQLTPKFDKYKLKNHYITQQHLFSELLLDKQANWTDYIYLKTEKMQKITLSFVIDCPEGVVRENCALFVVDFDEYNPKHKGTNLSFSETVGWYKYIITKANCKYRISYSFNVPVEVPVIKIGLQSWYSNIPIRIFDAVLYTQDLT